MTVGPLAEKISGLSMTESRLTKTNCPLIKTNRGLSENVSRLAKTNRGLTKAARRAPPFGPPVQSAP